jgi:putative FmdB family regulatory protein
MSDRYRCLDCGQSFCAVMRWIAEESVPTCPSCGSLALRRVRTFWRTLRDSFILTNAA